MGDTALDFADDDGIPAPVALSSSWADGEVEVVRSDDGKAVATVTGDPTVPPPSAQPADGEAYFAIWHHESGDRRGLDEPAIIKKRTIRHLSSSKSSHAAPRRRSELNQQRWAVEVHLLEGAVTAINDDIAMNERLNALPPGAIGRLPTVLGYWIDTGEGLSADAVAHRGSQGPFLAIALSRLGGRTFHDLIPGPAGLQPSDAADILEAAALTLSQVHKAGYWFGDISEHNLLALSFWERVDVSPGAADPQRLRPRRRWLVNLCDVEQMTPHDPDATPGGPWGATPPFATVMPGDRRPSYESELANLAYRACLLFFGQTPEGECPTDPDLESGLPTPLLGLLRRAGRSAELRRAARTGTLAPEFQDIAAFGRWIRTLTPLSDEPPGHYFVRVDAASEKSPVSAEVRKDLIAWAETLDPKSNSLALAYAAKIALADADGSSRSDRARYEAAELLVRAVNAVDVSRLRRLLDAADLDPLMLRDDINPNLHGDAIRRLAEAYPEADWRTGDGGLRSAFDVRGELPPPLPRRRPPAPLPSAPLLGTSGLPLRPAHLRSPLPADLSWSPVHSGELTLPGLVPPSAYREAGSAPWPPAPLRRRRRPLPPLPAPTLARDAPVSGDRGAPSDATVPRRSLRQARDEHLYSLDFLTDPWLQQMEDGCPRLRDPRVPSGDYLVKVADAPHLSFYLSVMVGRLVELGRKPKGDLRGSTRISALELWHLLVDDVRLVSRYGSSPGDAVAVLRRLGPPRHVIQLISRWNPDVVATSGAPASPVGAPRTGAVGSARSRSRVDYCGSWSNVEVDQK